MDNKPLTSAIDNVLAYRLGKVAREAGGPREDVGDLIDRGLILRRLLDEKGFYLIKEPEILKSPTPTLTHKKS